jgi:ankyrin repeat protein
MVDFIIQNSSSLDRRTREGNTPLHYCVIQNQPEAMRLLLRSGASPDLANNNGKTPLSIAKERGYHLCEELVRAKNTTDIFAFFSEKSNVIKYRNQRPPHIWLNICAFPHILGKPSSYITCN